MRSVLCWYRAAQFTFTSPFAEFKCFVGAKTIFSDHFGWVRRSKCCCWQAAFHPEGSIGSRPAKVTHKWVSSSSRINSNNSQVGKKRKLNYCKLSNHKMKVPTILLQSPWLWMYEKARLWEGINHNIKSEDKDLDSQSS